MGGGSNGKIIAWALAWKADLLEIPGTGMVSKDCDDAILWKI